MQGCPVHEQTLPEVSRTKVRELLECLCRKELLRVIDATNCDSLYFRYALCKPLQETTIFDILRATNGSIYLSIDDMKEAYDSYGIAGRRLGVMNDMVCYFLSQINLTEIILPNEENTPIK